MSAVSETLQGAPSVLRVLATVERLCADVVEQAAERRSDWVHRYGVGRRRVDLDNLAAYVALRQHDLRNLQEQLAEIGLSSLGRNEPHVVAGLEAVHRALVALAGDVSAVSDPDGAGVREARRRASERVGIARTALFGEPAGVRRTRILVTLPAAAADDPGLATDLVAAGADSFRINAAHDDPDVWVAMAAHVRAAASAAGRWTPILVDLAGPKLRVGPLEDGPAIVRIKPRRDPSGAVIQAATVLLDGSGVPGGPGRLAVDAAWLQRLETGDEVRTRDVRGRTRVLEVTRHVDGSVELSCTRGCFLGQGLRLERWRDGRDLADPATAGPVQSSPGSFRLSAGDRFRLVRGAERGTGVVRDPSGVIVEPARLSCAEPGVAELLEPGQRVLIDDGRLEGVVVGVDRSGALVEVVRAPDQGLRIREDKGINLPDTELRLPMLSRRDRTELRSIVALADSIGCSFVRTGDEMAYLSQVIAAQGGEDTGLVVKVETEAAAFALPDILAAVRGAHPLGVMIARGDLAVELGWERLVEYQRRILWFCQAAHVPVVWATQVLDSMMRSGVPSRAELTDAAEAERADCVMLNKGDHVVETVGLLDQILTRMQDHVDQKRDLLPTLRHLD